MFRFRALSITTIALAGGILAPQIAPPAEAQIYFRSNARGNFAVVNRQQQIQRVIRQSQERRVTVREQPKPTGMSNMARRRIVERVIERNRAAQQTGKPTRNVFRRATQPVGPAAAVNSAGSDKRVNYGASSNDPPKSSKLFIQRSDPIGFGKPTGGQPKDPKSTGGATAKATGAPDNRIQFNDPVGKGAKTDPAAGSGAGGKTATGAPDNPIQFGQPVGTAAKDKSPLAGGKTLNFGAIGTGRGTGTGAGPGTPIKFNTGAQAERPQNSKPIGSGRDAANERTSEPARQAPLRTGSTSRDKDQDDGSGGKARASSGSGSGSSGGSSSAAARVATAPAAAAAAAAAATAASSGGYWNHNKSRMRVLQEEDALQVVYERPRDGLGNLGIEPGTVLFNGKSAGGNAVAGEATTFSPRQCGPATFAVTGDVSADGKRLTLRGHKPTRDGKCQVSGYSPETLGFDLVD